jgi:hypothetical protein
MVAGATLVASALRLRFGDEALSNWMRKGWTFLTGLKGWKLVATLLALVVWWVLASQLGNTGRSVFQGLHPLNPSVFALPAMMLHFLPLGVAVLMGLGIIYALRRPLPFALAPLSFIVLYRTYHALGSSFFVLFRYYAYVIPYALFFALFGFRELEAIATRRAWGPRWRPVAVGILALTCMLFPLPGTMQLWIEGHVEPSLTSLILDRNEQREVRYLLDLEARFPNCTFVARLARRGNDPWRPLEPEEYTLVTFGGRRGSRPSQTWSDSALARTLENIQPADSCVLFYRSLDCNFSHGDGCKRQLEGLPVVDEKVFANAPYNSVSERGGPGPVVTLGVYRLR